MSKQSLINNMPGFLRRNLRKRLYGLFLSLDDSLQHNVANGAAPRPEIPSNETSTAIAAPAEGGAARRRRPRIVNEGWLPTSEDDIEMLLDAIFAEPSLAAVRADVFDYLKDNRQAWASQPILIEEITQFVVQRFEREQQPSQIAATGDALAAVAHHIETSERSRVAYTPEGKKGTNVVFWPDPTYEKAPRSLFTEIPAATTYPFITPQTPIGSAGSCFAMEIAIWLQENGFNYIVTEPDPHPQSGISMSCARWGIIFNTPSFRQLVERAFGLRETPPLLWTQRKPDGTMVLLDPFRENIEFSSVEEYEADYPRHAALAREAFLQAKVFVFTLGVNEVWRLKSDGSVFSRAPWRVSPELVEPIVMTAEQNVQELTRMIEILRQHNPDLKIIVTVSPVPLHATFRGTEHHVIAANCHSKSTLRVAAEEISRRLKDVYYFPSYETVMYCTETPWQADQRHVTRETVGRVMELFQRMFVLK